MYDERLESVKEEYQKIERFFEESLEDKDFDEDIKHAMRSNKTTGLYVKANESPPIQSSGSELYNRICVEFVFKLLDEVKEENISKRDVSLILNSIITWVHGEMNSVHFKNQKREVPEEDPSQVMTEKDYHREYNNLMERLENKDNLKPNDIFVLATLIESEDYENNKKIKEITLELFEEIMNLKFKKEYEWNKIYENLLIAQSSILKTLLNFDR